MCIEIDFEIFFLINKFSDKIKVSKLLTEKLFLKHVVVHMPK